MAKSSRYFTEYEPPHDRLESILKSCKLDKPLPHSNEDEVKTVADRYRTFVDEIREWAIELSRQNTMNERHARYLSFMTPRAKKIQATLLAKNASKTPLTSKVKAEPEPPEAKVAPKPKKPTLTEEEYSWKYYNGDPLPEWMRRDLGYAEC